MPIGDAGAGSVTGGLGSDAVGGTGVVPTCAGPVVFHRMSTGCAVMPAALLYFAAHPATPRAQREARARRLDERRRVVTVIGIIEFNLVNL